MPNKPSDVSTNQVELSKQRVKRFFKKLESSPLNKLMNFQSTQEKVQAILKFSDIVGIPHSKLPILINQLRKTFDE